MYFVSLSTEEPDISIDLKAQDYLNCRAGSQIKITAVISGRPVPKTSWEFDGAAQKEIKVKRATMGSRYASL